MHRCLLISEILGQVSTYLDNSDLLSTALTCQDFKPSALRELWRHLHDLSPVIECFPRDAWYLKEYVWGLYGGPMAYEYVHTRNLTPQDWEAVLPYLPMIHTISKYPNPLHRVDVSNALFGRMITSFPGETPFPNIREISLKQDVGLTLNFIQSFLKPQLQGLEIYYPPNSAEEARVSLVFSIPLLFPSLKRLCLASRERYHPAISEAVCQLPQLEELTITWISESAFVYISQLHNLRKLEIRGCSTPTFDSFPPTPSPSFPALTTLTVHDQSLSFHIGILAAISSVQLKFYAVTSGELLTAEHWEDLWSQLTALPRHLQEITFRFECWYDYVDWKDQKYLVTSEKLRPILSFGHLTILRLACVFDLEDEFVLELARACTKLLRIELGTDCRNHKRSKATLMSYVYLVQYCPQIHTIGLIIDASQDTRSMKLKPTRGTQVSKKISFVVGDSFIEDPTAVASFLSSLACLECKDPVTIRTKNRGPPDIARKWEAVQKQLPALIAAGTWKLESGQNLNSIGGDRGDDEPMLTTDPGRC